MLLDKNERLGLHWVIALDIALAIAAAMLATFGGLGYVTAVREQRQLFLHFMVGDATAVGLPASSETAIHLIAPSARATLQRETAVPDWLPNQADSAERLQPIKIAVRTYLER